MKGYLCKPAKGGKAAGVVVIHENRGLNPYIQDVARRLAAEGYVAFAPDALAPVGGYTGNEETAVAAFDKLDAPSGPRTCWPPIRSSRRAPNATAASARWASASAAAW
jgi:carboxymethylenebutenolidase